MWLRLVAVLFSGRFMVLMWVFLFLYDLLGLKSVSAEDVVFVVVEVGVIVAFTNEALVFASAGSSLTTGSLF